MFEAQTVKAVALKVHGKIIADMYHLIATEAKLGYLSTFLPELRAPEYAAVQASLIDNGFKVRGGRERLFVSWGDS